MGGAAFTIIVSLVVVFATTKRERRVGDRSRAPAEAGSEEPLPTRLVPSDAEVSQDPCGDGAAEDEGPDWSEAWRYLTPSEATRRDQLVRARRVWRESAGMPESVGEHVARIMALMDSGELTILKPRDPWSRWNVWNLGTQVMALLGQPGLDDQRKAELGTRFFRALGLLGEAEPSTDPVELWVDLATYKTSIQEARWLAQVLGDGFTEDQAKRFAVGLAGLVTGQRQLRELWAFRIGAPSDESLVIQLDDALRSATESKRRFMEQLLTPAQYGTLYEGMGYDSETFWRTRLSSEESDD